MIDLKESGCEITTFNPPWSVHPDKDLPLNVFLEKLELLDLKGSVRNTRHWDYKRVFIFKKDDDQNTLGRACIYQDYFSHINWFGSSTVKIQIMWNIFKRYGHVTTNEDWESAIAFAKIEADKKHKINIKSYQDRLIWAKNTPRPNGKPRKMPKHPQYPDKYKFVYNELEKIIKDNYGR